MTRLVIDGGKLSWSDVAVDAASTFVSMTAAAAKTQAEQEQRHKAMDAKTAEVMSDVLANGERFASLSDPPGLDGMSGDVATVLCASRIVDGVPQVVVTGERPGWFESRIVVPVEKALSFVGDVLTFGARTGASRSRWGARPAAPTTSLANGRLSGARNVWHATPSTRAAQGVLDRIDTGFLNPKNRFGKAFYVAEQPGTTIAELAHHNVETTHAIRFELNRNDMVVLDLTDANIARAWGYEGGPITPATRNIGLQAQAMGYNVIRFNSERTSGGVNFPVLDNHNEILRPVGMAPAK